MVMADDDSIFEGRSSRRILAYHRVRRRDESKTFLDAIVRRSTSLSGAALPKILTGDRKER
jgi:hypothetical protein